MGSCPIGLFYLQLALHSGAETVIVSQPSAPRREFAASLGAHLTVDPTTEDLSSVVAEITGGLGVDVAIICIGKPGLVNDALGLVRRGGSVNIFAGFPGEGWAELEANSRSPASPTVAAPADTVGQGGCELDGDPSLPPRRGQRRPHSMANGEGIKVTVVS